MATAVDGCDAYRRHANASSQETLTNNPRVVKENTYYFRLSLGSDDGGDDEEAYDERRCGCGFVREWEYRARECPMRHETDEKDAD